MDTEPAKVSRRQKIALVIASTVVTLALAELALKLFAPIYLAQSTAVYQYDEELGVRAQPNVNYRGLTDHLQEFVTNAHGTVNYFDDFSDWEKVVFAIGDSFTQGTGVSPDASYPFQLDLALNAQNGEYRKQFAVMNLGLGAYGLMQETITARRFAKLIRRPDFILQLGYGNDVGDDALFQSGYRHEHLVEGNPNWYGLGGALGWVSERVEIIKRIKLGIDRLRASAAREGSSAPRGGPDSASQTLASQLEKQYSALKALSDELGAKLIVSWAVCDGTPAGEGSYAWLKQWSAGNGVLFADWCGTALSVLAAQPNLPMSNSHSGGHYRPWVYGIIADAFAAEIRGASSGTSEEASFSRPATPQ